MPLLAVAPAPDTVVAMDDDGAPEVVQERPHRSVDDRVARTGPERQPALEEAVLARALRDAPNEDAASLAFDRYAPLVRRILARTLGPFYDVEDHVQETFITFFRQVRTLKNDESLRAFLVSIAVRHARHELRRRRVRRIFHLRPPEEIPDVVGSTGISDVEAREALRRLFEILDDLDAPSRLAFTLRHLEHMELAEVATAVGESLASVKRRLGRIVPIVNARIARDAALAPYLEGARS